MNEGGIAAFYRGLTPNLIGNSSSWAIYFLCYGNIKDGMRRLYPGREELTSSNYFVASGAAGMTGSSHYTYTVVELTDEQAC